MGGCSQGRGFILPRQEMHGAGVASSQPRLGWPMLQLWQRSSAKVTRVRSFSLDMASPGLFVQVHPELFTKALIQKVQEAGGELRLAKFVGLKTEGGRVTGVRIVNQGTQEETLLPADVVVLAMGKRCNRVARVLFGNN